MQVPEDTPSISQAGPCPRPAAGDSEVPMEEARKLAFAVAMSLLVGHPDRREIAEELAQDAMVRIIRSREPIRESWRALVRTTIARLVSNHRRDAATESSHLCFNSEAASEARDGWPNPLDLLIEEEDEGRLKLLLEEIDESLGNGTRVIVELRLQDTPWAEIADIVGLSLRTCSLREAKALDWLNNRLSLQIARERAS